MAGDFPTRVEEQRGPGLPGAAGQGLAARTCLTPPARSRVTGDTGAAPAPGIWHLPGDGDRTSALEWGLLPYCSSHRRWTHPPGHGEDARYCGQNEGFLAVVPAVGGLDGLDAMLLTFFFFCRGALSAGGGHFGPRGQEPSPSCLPRGRGGCGCCTVQPGSAASPARVTLS